ncbi:MAG: methanethiol S-methyltransferase [Phycisphaerales bacterium]
MMFARWLMFVFGVLAYTFFFVTFCYTILFVTDLFVPKSMNRGGVVDGPGWLAIAINAGLLGAFAVQHTIMARPAFKRWWTRVVPEPIERSVFVFLATAILAALLWAWRPMTDWSLWTVETPWLRMLLTAISIVGFGLVLFSSFLIDHFELFGVRQVTLPLMGREYEPPRFVERSIYKVVRHPLMLGFLIAFWFTPNMTAGHLLFAILTTGYIFIGIWFEERTLVSIHGEKYLAYRRRAGMVLPRVRRRRGAKGGGEPMVPAG